MWKWGFRHPFLALSCIELESRPSYHDGMALEIARLCLGLLIAGFHVRIADFVLAQEEVLIVAFRRRGLELPTAFPKKHAHNFYFAVGITIAIIQLLRLHQLVS